MNKDPREIASGPGPKGADGDRRLTIAKMLRQHAQDGHYEKRSEELRRASHPARDQLMSYAGAHLKSEAAEKIAFHIFYCDSCRQAVWEEEARIGGKEKARRKVKSESASAEALQERSDESTY